MEDRPASEVLEGALSVLKQDSMVGAGAEGKAFLTPSPSPCADLAVGLGHIP